jgi:hypothetical protein
MTRISRTADWISGACLGPPESLPVQIKQYWRVRDRLRLVESVTMMEDRAIVPGFWSDIEV